MTAPDCDAHSGRPAPELAAAMAETRKIRGAAAEVADRWDAQAAKCDKAREGTLNEDFRLLYQRSAEMLRAHARAVRELAGIPQPQNGGNTS